MSFILRLVCEFAGHDWRPTFLNRDSKHDITLVRIDCHRCGATTIKNINQLRLRAFILHDSLPKRSS